MLKLHFRRINLKNLQNKIKNHEIISNSAIALIDLEEQNERKYYEQIFDSIMIRPILDIEQDRKAKMRKLRYDYAEIILYSVINNKIEEVVYRLKK